MDKQEYEKQLAMHRQISKCFIDRRKSLAKQLDIALKNGYNINFSPYQTIEWGTILVKSLYRYRSYVGDAFFYHKALDRMLEAGADVNMKNPDNWTPLMYAIMYTSDIYNIRKIFERTRDINAISTDFHETAFSMLCTEIITRMTFSEEGFKQNIRLIKDFIDAGANPYLDKSWLEKSYGYEKERKLQKKLADYIEQYSEQKELSEQTRSGYEYEL